MFIRIHPDSGVPIYLQIVQQVTHAIEIGALQANEQLPPIRGLAEALITNPNTVAKAYRELEYRGVVELRQGIGAFVQRDSAATGQAEAVKQAHQLMAATLASMKELGLSNASMRGVFEAELAQKDEVPLDVSSRR